MQIPMLYDHKREEHGSILAKLAGIVDAGALKPLLDETQFGLEEAGKAHDHLTNVEAIGKVVVEIQGIARIGLSSERAVIGSGTSTDLHKHEEQECK